MTLEPHLRASPVAATSASTSLLVHVWGSAPQRALLVATLSRERGWCCGGEVRSLIRSTEGLHRCPFTLQCDGDPPWFRVLPLALDGPADNQGLRPGQDE
jgi:hypothetical protein